MKTWRRLQQLGAVAIRDAVYVLPNSPQAREDFEWMKAEIVGSRGEASVFAAGTIDSLTEDDIVAAFRADRERSFKAIREEARSLTSHRLRARARGTDLRRFQRTGRRLRERFTEVVGRDFFGAGGREEASDALADLERMLARPAPGMPEPADREKVLRTEDYRGRSWLTRPRPGIDRAGSAWLIRRFIDPAARFVFAERPQPRSSSVPFDMYDVEFSHHGERCTFEVLLKRFGITDPAAVQIGRLVHDLDLKESRYNVPEAAAVGKLIDGLRRQYLRDEQLLEQGIVVFEALYRVFASELHSVGAKGQVKRRAGNGTKGR